MASLQRVTFLSFIIIRKGCDGTGRGKPGGTPAAGLGDPGGSTRKLQVLEVAPGVSRSWWPALAPLGAEVSPKLRALMQIALHADGTLNAGVGGSVREEA